MVRIIPAPVYILVGYLRLSLAKLYLHIMMGYLNTTQTKYQTLGVLPFLQNAYFQNTFPSLHDREDWEALNQNIIKNWNPFVTGDASIQFSFKDLIDQISLVSKLRNSAAHPGHFTRLELIELWQLLFIKTKKSVVGMVPALLSGWKVKIKI